MSESTTLVVIFYSKFSLSEPMKMSMCEAYSTHNPSGQCDTGDVIQMTECAAYISHPAKRKHQQEHDSDYIVIQ